MKNKRTWITLLISLLGSIFLWAYVVTNVSVNVTETFEKIPVTFVGEESLHDRSLTITSGRDATVTLRITGKRSVITTLDTSNITISVDVSKIQGADSFTRSYSISYPNSIQTSQLTEESRNPSSISFTVEELVTKEIPVKTVWNGSLAEGYMLESCQPTVNTLSVTGTASQVEPLAQALVIVEEQDVNAGSTKNMNFVIVDSEGNEADVSGLGLEIDSVGVTTKVLFTKQVPLALALKAGGGATEANVMWEIDPPFVTVAGEEATLKDLNKIVLETINLAVVSDNMSLNRPILLPDGVRCESGEISADIIITLVGLSKKNIPVSEIDFVNVPAGYVAQAVTNSMTVTVRGPASSVDQLDVGNVRVVADLSDNAGSSGNFTCNDVRVFVDNAANDCGVLGEYSVSYKLLTEEEYLALLEAEDDEDGGTIG